MTTIEHRHWKRYPVHMKLHIVATGEEYICELVDISPGGLQVKFSDSHMIKVNDICKLLSKVHETELMEINYNSSSNDLVSVKLEDAIYKDNLTADLEASDNWDEIPVLAAVTWIKDANAGLVFEEVLSDKDKMPIWFYEAYYSEYRK